MVSQQTIDAIRDAADIVETLSSYIQLKKQGQNFVGLCPFHDDSRPSLHVSPRKQIYKCFVCGNGGNSISFVMDYEKINFMDALKQLGARHGISVDLSDNPEKKEFFSHLYDIHEFAMKTYCDNLFSTSGKPVLQYLLDRGLSETTIKNFKLGLAGKGWEELYNRAKQANYPQDVIEKSGLFTKTDKGIFDRFRDRIMFPIFQTSSRVIAFGGRALDNNEPAKYLNSPDTPLYHKTNVFYGLHASRESIRKNEYSVLVEGYMDFLQLYQAGIEPVVAVSGTALSERHVQHIHKFTTKAVLAYDGDKAGVNAAIRAGYLLMQGGLEVVVLPIPKDKDPDDWIRSVGSEVVQEAINSAIPFLSFHIESKKATKMSPAERSQFVQDILQQVAPLKDEIMRNDFIKTLSQVFQVQERELLRQLFTYRSRRRKPGSSTKTEPINEISNVIQKAQATILRVLAGDNLDIRQKAREMIDLDYFTHPILKNIGKTLLPLYEKINTASIVDQFENPEERKLVTRILMDDLEISEPEQTLKDCLFILETHPIKETIKETRMKIREKESKNEDATEEMLLVTQLQQELNQKKGENA